MTDATDPAEASEFGAMVAALCFAAILVPLAIAGHLATSLALLRTPLDLIEEVPVEDRGGLERGKR